MKHTILYWISLAITGISICVTFPIFAENVYLFLALLVLFPSLVRYFVFRRVPSKFRLNDKEVAIVTGAGAGIGTEIAKELCVRGAKVIWSARDEPKANKVLNDIVWSDGHGPTGYVLQIDLASKKSIEKFVQEFKKRENRLDVIILNAAYHGPRRLTEDGFEQTIGVNHLGHMYLVYLLMEMLKKSPSSRIVVVASDLHNLCKRVRFDDLSDVKNYSPWNAYNHSKLLNILFVKELSKRLKGTNVTVHAAHPGTPVITELMRYSWLGTYILNQMIFPFLGYLYLRSKREAAQTPLYCALSEECGKNSGLYFENCRKTTPSKAALDEITAEKLWNISCDLLKIKRNW